MQPQHLTAGFLQEASDLLAQVEETVLDLNGSEAAPETIDHLFRAFHTIKGSAGMFGFESVSTFTHHIENTLDDVRKGSVAPSAELMEIVLAAADHIRSLLAGAADEDSAAPLLQQLSSLPGAAAGSAPKPETAKLMRWQIRFRPDPALLASGGNPVLILRESQDMGHCTIECYTEAVPALAWLEVDKCYLSWTIQLETRCSAQAIRDVFLFVEDGSEIVIEAVAEQTGGVAVQTSSPTRTANPGTHRKNSLEQATVRVPSHKLDQLVNLVGELVMNQSRLTQAASRSDDPALAAPVEEIERLVAELRDSVLGIRMMPIGTTFSRFKRLVHDLSAELGKEIDLVTEGAETELDKTVLDQLGDPLIHLIRNSIDHGIEPKEDRLATGKPARGTIRLTALHTGSNVVVSIQDDGRGLNTAAIRAKAVERGLITADANLSERECCNLIFLPGFSTAGQVTNVSGRGVGMDVVRRQIDALSGSIAVASQEGVGTTISLTLPLTLAIIDGLLIQVANEPYIVPMSLVTENVELQMAERHRNNGRNVVAVRGELIPYISLRDEFKTGGIRPDIEKIVIVRHEDQRVGLVVDRVIGSHQTVIQSLGSFYRDVEAFSGATIMGDGRVALILEVAGLVRSADAHPRREAA